MGLLKELVQYLLTWTKLQLCVQRLLNLVLWKEKVDKPQKYTWKYERPGAESNKDSLFFLLLQNSCNLDHIIMNFLSFRKKMTNFYSKSVLKVVNIINFRVFLQDSMFTGSTTYWVLKVIQWKTEYYVVTRLKIRFFYSIWSYYTFSFEMPDNTLLQTESIKKDETVFHSRFKGRLFPESFLEPQVESGGM